MTEAPSENPVLGLDVIRGLMSDRKSAYEWVSAEGRTYEDLKKVRDSLNIHFPGTRVIEDESMQTVFQIVDGAMFQIERATQAKE